MSEIAKHPITALTAENETRLRQGVSDGLSYRAIGAGYLPHPVPSGTAYRHAVKLGIADKHPMRGKRGKPYSLNPYDSIRS